MYRLFPVVLAVFAMVLFVNETLFAQDIHEGIVVGAGNGSLAMTDIYGENMHSHMGSPNARIILDGTPAKLEELKMGDHVLVTTRHQDRRTRVVIRIDAHSAR